MSKKPEQSTTKFDQTLSLKLSHNAIQPESNMDISKIINIMDKDIKYTMIELHFTDQQQEECQQRIGSMPRFLAGEMYGVMESGKIFRAAQAQKLGLSEEEVQEREVLERRVVSQKLPNSIDPDKLCQALSEIKQISQEVVKWKQSHPNDPLIEELVAVLTSREKTAQMLLGFSKSPP